MTTEELLNEMEREAEFHSEETPVCIIDPETRTITVPPEYQLLGVESDEKVERLYFQCPKIVGDNVDLSQLILFINYQNAGQEIDAYKITDVETDGDNITFSWLLDRKVTAYRTTQQNKLGFSFCAQKADEDGTLTQEWNTTVNTECSVLEGLEAQEHIEEENSAAIAQIWAAIDQLKASGGGGGTTNYENLSNKPQLNGVTLEGNKTLDQVGVLAKNQGASNSGKYLSVGSDGNVVPTDAPSGGTVDPEQIKQAVNGYLEENPVSGMTAEQEQQLNQNTTDIADLKSAINQKGLPEGGTTGQVLVKKTDSDYEVEWKTIENTDSGGSEIPTYKNLIDISDYQRIGYENKPDIPNSYNVFGQYGKNYISVTGKKYIYYRIYRNNKVSNVLSLGIVISCYGNENLFINYYKDDNTDKDKSPVSLFSEISSQFNLDGLETVDSDIVYTKGFVRFEIPEGTESIKFSIATNSYCTITLYPALWVSFEQITNYGSITENNLLPVEGSSGSEGGNTETIYKPLLNKTLYFIGDSLTNWGGGGDAQDGFLKIIHDQTGLLTINKGLAGATWEEADGQTEPGVKRVDEYIERDIKYDCICFLLGTNMSNQGTIDDTSETKTTMCGAIKYCLEKLITYSPTTPILVFLPPQRAEGNTEQKARNDIIKQICEIYGVYTFDLYTRSQVIPNTIVAENGTLSDGLHLSEKGQQNFGRIMSTAILDVMGY